MSKDGNEQSEIAEIGLLINEKEITLRWFFETFKKITQFRSKLMYMLQRYEGKKCDKASLPQCITNHMFIPHIKDFQSGIYV